MIDMYSIVKTSQQPQNPVINPCSTPRTEGASTNVHITQENLRPIFDNHTSHDVPINNNGPSLGGKKYVVLLGQAREDVAKGYIGYQRTCHGRDVQDGEKVVWVTEVLKPEAPIYDGPQNGHSHLCELADGGFTIWATNRIRYL
ncbi:hypothetical protein M6B38_197385 [Iris pallida]|uniref:Uncharacterized protein n=1 Tax=Iris pallida TaxID=29817 RepID=A0AAX6EBU7_IRIPA|nr:hypothetical protein M6B38_197385 [Iris pallida]